MDNPPPSSTPAFGMFTPSSTAGSQSLKGENPSTGLSVGTPPVFGTFTASSAPAAGSGTTQNLFSQALPVEATSQFGNPAMGTSSVFGSSGASVFGSQMKSPTFGGNFVPKPATSSAPLFGKVPGSSTFGSQGMTQSSFQNPVSNQNQVFGSIGQAPSFPSSTLFGASSTANSSSASQSLFGKNVPNTAMSSQAPTTLTSGVSAPSSGSMFKTLNKNPLGGGAVSTSAPALFSGTKPSGVVPTSSSTNVLFGKNVSSVSVSSQSTAAVMTVASTNQNLGIQNKNPFGGVSISAPPPLFSGTKAKQPETGTSISTATLFGKPIQEAPLSTGSQKGPSTVFSSQAGSYTNPDSHKSLFGKPQTQNPPFSEDLDREHSISSEVRENTSQRDPLFPSPPTTASIQGSLASESSRLPRYQETEGAEPESSYQPSLSSAEGAISERAKRNDDGLFTAHKRTSVPDQISAPGVKLFRKSLPANSPSPDRSRQENDAVEKEEISNTMSPRKSLSKWSSSREAKGGLKRKGRLFSSSLNKPGTGTTGRLLSTLQSRRMAGEQNSLKTLTVRNIPPEYNKEETLRSHFSKFGKVTRFRLTEAKHMLTLSYDSHESALIAKKEGPYIDNDTEPLDIFLRASPRVKKDRELSKQSGGMSVEDELQSMSEAGYFEVEKDPVPKAPSSHRTRTEQRGQERKRSLTPPPTSSRKTKPESRPVERKRSPTPPPSSIHTSDLKESAPLDIDVIKDLLKSLQSARATNTPEKIVVLDKRDKILKLLRGRPQADYASAKAFVGICPDMCPEKERYYREDIRRLALYEVILSTMSTVAGQKTKVDHSKAVKEYSRSSADQEEPLPQDLRPLPVLFDTMIYLLTEVADQGGEGKWSEWYDFLWNRTRGIRKEITQQQLCTVEVAELLEKCARLHIFCSERLCEEDMMSFDDKINNENLTKCLQTLKELYADLETKQGISCPNETEFRAYMALMKLNEGDTLREVQQLRPELRESGPIKFAIQAHSALNNKNYVRFFRLIEETTFLNGCILHRYFNQIRGQALRIIRRAYYRGTTSKFSVDEMIRLLKFEDSQQVQDFCSYYYVGIDGSDVILDSRSFLEPESSIPHFRSPSLIESKQTLSVGETIYGGPLPAFKLPPPLSSFDEEGNFIFSREFEQALVQGGLKFSSLGGGLSYSQPKPAPLMPVPLPKERYSTEAIRSTVRTLILVETDAQTMSVAKEVVLEEKERLASIAQWLKDMIGVTVAEEVKIIAEEAVASEEANLRQQLEFDRQKQRELAIESLCVGLQVEVGKEEVAQIANEEMSRVKQALHVHRKERCAHAYAGDLLERVVDEAIEDLVTDVYEVDVVARREQLNENERLVHLMRVSRWFRIWRDRYLRSVRVRRAMLDFPAAPPTVPQTDQIAALVPVRPSDRIRKSAFYIGRRARLNILSPMDIFRQGLHLSAHLSMASAQQMLFNIRMWQPIDLASCVGNQLLRAAQQWNETASDVLDALSIQWKLVLSLPKEKFENSEKEQKFIQWLRAKLSRKSGKKNKTEKSPPYEGEILSQYTVQLPQKGKKFGDPSLSFCLRCFHGAWNDSQLPEIKKKNLLKGAGGILFVTHTAEQLLEQKFLWKKDQQRLHQLFTEKTKNPALPLVIIIPRTTSACTVDLDSVKTFLKLDDLHTAGLLLAVHNAQPFVDTGDVFADVNAEWATQLTSCLRYLATHIPSPPGLRVKNISDFVEDAVVEYYKAPVYQDLRTRSRHQMLHQSPNVLISLYNDIIEHVGMASSSDSLTKFSWPAPEFDNPESEFNSDWNSESHLADVYELITMLRLPTFRYSDRDKDDWATLCQDVWSYMNVMTKKDSGSAKICLFQEITALLQSTKKQFDQHCWLASEDGPCEPSYVNMAWTDFIDACIHYRLVSLRTGHQHIEVPESDDETEIKGDDVKELLVYFHEDELVDWEAPLSWEDALRDTDGLEVGQLKSTVQRAATKRDKSFMDQSHDISDRDTEPEGDTTATSDNVTERQSEASLTASLASPDSWSQLKARFEMERRESDRLQNVLLSSLRSPSLSDSRDGFDSLGSQDKVNSNSRGLGHSSLPNKRRRISDEKEELPSPLSSSDVTPRSDLPKSRFKKLPRLETSQRDSADETSSAENSFEEKLEGAIAAQSLSTRLEDFKRQLEEERRADKLFQMKMSTWLSSHPE